MLNLAKYRKTTAYLADYLPWAFLVAPGVVLNKDGSFNAPSAIVVPTSTAPPKPNWFRSRRGSTMSSSDSARGGRCSSRPSACPPGTIQARGLPMQRPGWSMRNGARRSKPTAPIMKAAIS